MENKKIKVLFFVDRFLRGGIQTFIWNHINALLNKDISIDCLVLDDGKCYEMETDLINIGINVYKLVGVWPITIDGYWHYINASRKFFREHSDYDIVHIHASSRAFPIAYYAKKNNISCIIAHSHTVQFQSASKLKKIVGNFMKKLYRAVCTNYMACSQEAAEWLFGEKLFLDNKCMILPNGIDFKQYNFDHKKALDMRMKYGLNGKYVIGNVARFNPEKNHTFLIEVFNEYHKKNRKSVLFLIGQGPNEKLIKDKVEKLGLIDCVIFAGYRNNVYDYLNLMDCFVFPSKFEGLGIALLEAQANGLPCITSAGRVPKEADVSGHVKYMPLEAGALEWVNKMTEDDFVRYNPGKMSECVYSLETTSNKLYEFYKCLVAEKSDG